MRYLGDQQGARSICNIASKAHQESAAVEHGVAAGGRALFGEGLDQGANNHEGAAKGCAKLSSESIGNVWGEGEGHNTTKVDDGAVET